MIVPDISLLVYAYNPGSAHHIEAKAWWEGLLNTGGRVGIPRVVILGFVRLTTTRGVLATPVTPADAMRRVESWLAAPGVVLVQPGPRHMAHLSKALTATPGGPLTTDAHLAALAIEHNAELHSNDSDFARFPGLRWRNPLA
jgi:hypothetical protein